MKTLSRCLICIVTAAFSLIAVNANSALEEWTGTDASGVVSEEEDCPLTVVHETLTFNLPGHLKSTHFSDAEWNAYQNSYTASYEITNPSDLDVTAVLAFPFGVPPLYFMNDTYEPVSYDDESKYSVTLNGELLEPEVRYTWAGGMQRSFHVDEELARLHDTYRQDPYFRPDLDVYVYTLHFEVDDSKKPDGPYINAECEIDCGTNQKIMVPEYLAGIRSVNGSLLTLVFQIPEENPDIELVSFGEEWQMPQWEYFLSDNREFHMEGTCEITDSQAVTYEEFLLSRRSPDCPVNNVDFYNAATDMFSTNGLVLYWQDNFENSLMKWYRYTIEAGPGETIVNEVTAPVYPSVFTNYDEPVEEYSYLLSPASRWKEFGSLDVIVKTSEHLIESAPRGFTETEDGYVLHAEGLPEGELSFRLCTISSPKRKNSYGGIIFAMLIMPVLFIILLIFLIFKIVKAFNSRRKS